MVHVRQGFFHYRAFWMTAGLTAGAATWALAIEPVGTPVLLQPVPPSNVIQTQAQGAPPQALRTQQAVNATAAAPAQPAGQKSAVQLKLEELYQQDGRQMPDLPDPQIPRQAPGQGGQAASPSQLQSPSSAPNAAAPASNGVQARPISNTSAQPGSQPQSGTWAQAQAAGAPRSTPAKKVPWIEQINPFKKRVSAAPPTEPAEIQYDPRRATGQFAPPQVQYQQPTQMAQQPMLQPGQVNPQTGRQNYAQLFAQPQTFAAPPTQGDPFVASAPIAVVPTPQLSPVTAGPTTPAAAAPVAVAQAPVFAPAIAPQTSPPAFAAQIPGPLVPPAALPAAAPPTANPAAPTPVANLPVLDFRQPIPLAAAPLQAAVPTQPTAAPALIIPAQPPAAQVAQLPLVLPQNPPSAAGPQSFVPQSTPPATPPSMAASSPPGNDSPFTGLGLNDAVPLTTPVAVPVPAGPPAVVAATPPLQVAALPTPPAAPPAVPATPAPAAVAAAPQSLPKLDGFFSEEEERQTDQPIVAKVPEQPRPLVVPTPPPAAEVPAFELPKPAAAAPPLVVATPSVPAAAAPVDVAAKAPAELPPLEFPPVAAAPQPLPAQEVAQSGSIPPLKPVPRQTDAAAGSKMALIAARSDQRGLKGFCPVMLRDHRELVDARPEHRSFYRNRIILLSSQEAKIVFESDPSKYAPAAAGNDVIHLAQTGEELEGSLEHAVWYKGRLYMFDSAETLETFVAAPSSHATND